MSLSIRGIMGALAVVATCLHSVPAPALDPSVARSVLESQGDAVITLEVTLLFKSNWGGQQQEQERKSETIATVIDARGLAVTALSNVDPSKSIELYYEDDEAMTVSVKSVRYIMPDGTEHDAALILRDPDLDLAFLRPLAEVASPMTFVDFSRQGKAGIYDEIFAIERAGRIARRSVLGKQGAVVGLIERPRLIYLPSVEIVTRRMGAPIYTAAGELLGLTALYHFPGGKHALGEDDDPSVAVIVPASDIADVARQAPDHAEGHAIPIEQTVTGDSDGQDETEMNVEPEGGEEEGSEEGM